jgi:hypothetical protein
MITMLMRMPLSLVDDYGVSEWYLKLGDECPGLGCDRGRGDDCKSKFRPTGAAKSESGGLTIRDGSKGFVPEVKVSIVLV